MKQQKHKDASLLETIAHGDILFPMEMHQSHIGFDNPILNVHWHKHMEISLVEKGSAVYTIDSVTRQVEVGDILLIGPEVLHSGQALLSVESENLTVVFDLSMLGGSVMDDCTSKFIQPLLTGEFELQGFIEAADKSEPEMVDCLKRIREEYNAQDFGFELAIKKELMKMLLLIYRKNYVSAFSKSDRHKLKEKMQIKDTIQYIDDHYQEKIYIDDVAGQIGYSSYHFIRLFKAYTGMTFIEYLNKVRIHKAAQMLTDSDVSVTGVSLSVGFNDVSYFVKKFKSIYNATPGEFRGIFHK